jgi:hypothetical protein
MHKTGPSPRAAPSDWPMPRVPVTCVARGRDCQSESEWRQLLKPFMEAAQPCEQARGLRCASVKTEGRGDPLFDSSNSRFDLSGKSEVWPGPIRVDISRHSVARLDSPASPLTPRKARLTSTNVTTNRTRAPSPSTAICGVMADKKSMGAKPTPETVCATAQG